MKTNQICYLTYLHIVLIFSGVVFSQCNSHRPSEKKETVTNQGKTVSATETVVSNPTDSVKLTALVRSLYKWHETSKMKYEDFKPIKSNVRDTVYSGIDLVENQKAIEEFKQTGLFAGSFLNDYRKIAVRMDKELRDGSSFWREGEIPTFSRDVNEWCNCQDNPDDYWNIIKLTDIKITNNEARFK